MSQNNTGAVYHETYRYYLEQLKSMRFDGKEAVLGITLDGDAIAVPYFGQSIRLTADGLKDEEGRRPDFSDCVVVCRYLIMCPLYEPKQKEWSAYRDFPDAGPLTVFWTDTVEGALARAFSGRVGALKQPASPGRQYAGYGHRLRSVPALHPAAQNTAAAGLQRCRRRFSRICLPAFRKAGIDLPGCRKPGHFGPCFIESAAGRSKRLNLPWQNAPLFQRYFSLHHHWLQMNPKHDVCRNLRQARKGCI